MITTEPKKSSPVRRARPTDHLLGVLQTLFRWKREILAVTLLAFVGAVIIALLLPVYYRATTTFLAMSPHQSQPERIFGDNNNAPEIYGNENDIDRLLTLAESNELVGFMVDSFDLYQHYDIDSTGGRSPYYVRKHFLGLYEVTKTKRDAIQLSIEDQEPEMAAAMARAARERINLISQNLLKQSQARTINTLKQDIANKQQQLTLLGDSLVQLRRRYGVYNSNAQSEALTVRASETESDLSDYQARMESFRQRGGRYLDSIPRLEARIRGFEQVKNNLDSQLVRFNEGMSVILTYDRQYHDLNQSLATDLEKLKQYEAAYNADIGATLVVEEASVPLVKERPHRSLIVMAAVVVAFFFSIVAVLLIENYRDINWREIYYGRPT